MTPNPPKPQPPSTKELVADALAYATKTRAIVEKYHLRKNGATVGEITQLFDRMKTMRAKLAAIASSYV